MKCDRCGERDAVVHLTQVEGEEARSVGLCEQCAAEKGIQTPTSVADTPLGGFLAALWKGAEPAVEAAPQGRCSGCGATFTDFRETGRLGCADCWLTFEVPLRVLLRRYHGSTLHRGRRQGGAGPAAEQPAAEQAQSLREQLRVAVEAENFELAAELRDRLKEIS